MKIRKINRALLSQLFDKNEKVIFIHLPKCGGTSLGSLIKRNYRFNRFKVDAKASVKTADYLDTELPIVRNILLNYAVNLGYKYISGHCHMHRPEEFEDYKIITVLRDPVKRFVSHYLYNRYKTHSTVDALKVEFEDFIKSDLAIEYGNLYCQYFSKTQKVSESIATLEKFSSVGILEDMTPIKNYISRELKIGGKVKRENKSPTKGKSKSDEIIAKYKGDIQKLCSDDIEIYKHFT